tara:strand:- start:5 stop:526 length:522 start_codon:yes stop_codon:yes gene_type:complete
MNILERLPDDLIRYTIDFIPNHYELNPFSATTIYLDKSRGMIYVICISPIAMIKFCKSHIVYVIKVRRFPRGIVCIVSFNKLQKILKLHKDHVILIANSWYINKSYKTLVDQLLPKKTLIQQFNQLFIQLIFLFFMRSLFVIKYKFLPFFGNYIIMFVAKILIQYVYDFLVIR